MNHAGAQSDLIARTMDVNSTEVNEISAELNNGDPAGAVIGIAARTPGSNPVGVGNEMMTVIQDEERAEAEDRNADQTKGELACKASDKTSTSHVKLVKATKTSRKRRGEEAKQLSKLRKSAR